MEQKTELEILYDRNVKGLSYRTLAKKYGISRTQIHRMVMSKQKKREKPKVIKPVAEEELALPDDIKDVERRVAFSTAKDRIAGLYD